MKKRVLILLALCILVITGSIYIGRKGGFLGTDDQIQTAISETNGEYKPWFKPIWQPPSKDIESMLFTVQASMGSGFLGYYIGRKKNVKVNCSTGKEQ